MVLLIPQAVKKLINKGRQEQRNRLKEALEQYGIEKDGMRTLTFTPEVEEFLNKNGDSSG